MRVQQITLMVKLVYIRLLKLVEHCKTGSKNIYLVLNYYLVQTHSFLLSPIHVYLCREALILLNPDEGLSSISGLIFTDDQKHLCKKKIVLLKILSYLYKSATILQQPSRRRCGKEPTIFNIWIAFLWRTYVMHLDSR